ncbi:carbon storage regulator CsrA [Lapillicoccus jejuensis]|uniref:Translational regulator CsrA n=1 Tax=Lapillicoccus jejuensis TaxID=402171 RepID=A0A542E4G5_9MICO|nr:carbon storage regulator CsrA [Lapillicoccus jejuensis]TQJ10179.1 carbon storage regulator CsrA [Lapillicoccus jejuensis]
MLVLSRRVGESVTIDGGVVVTVLEVRSDGVRIGIDAPRSVKVHRSELLEELGRRNQEAASPQEDVVSSLQDALRRRTGGEAAADEAPSTDPAPERE